MREEKHLRGKKGKAEENVFTRKLLRIVIVSRALKYALFHSYIFRIKLVKIHRKKKGEEQQQQQGKSNNNRK